MATPAGHGIQGQYIAGKEPQYKDPRSGKDPQSILSTSPQPQLSARLVAPRRSRFSKHRSSIVPPGLIPFFFDPLIDIARRNEIFLRLARQAMKFTNSFLFVALPDAALVHGSLQNADGLIIDFNRHGKGVTVLAAMRKGKTGRITEPRRCPVYH